MKVLVLLAFLVFLGGCGPRSIGDYREKGSGIVRTIIQELQGVRSRQDLMISSKYLEQLFNELADLMIAAHEFSRKQNGLDDLGEVDDELNDQFRFELNRIYRIEGARKILEKCQEQALLRLDAYKRRT